MSCDCSDYKYSIADRCATGKQDIHLDRGATYVVLGQIHQASGNGDVQAVTSLLNDDPKLLNTRDNVLGDTPLAWAARMGQVEAVKLLAGRGAMVDTFNFNGDSPLSLAATEGFLNVIDCLLDAGADVNLRDPHGSTALHWAASEGRLEVVQHLVAKGAPPRVKDNEGQLPAQWAASDGHADVARFLDSHGSP